MTATVPPTWQPDWQSPQEPVSKPLWKQKKVAIPATVLGGIIALGVLGAAVGPAPTADVRNAASDSQVSDQVAADEAAAAAALAQAEADRAATEKIAAETAAAEAAAAKAAAEKAAAEQAAAEQAAAEQAAAAAVPTVDFAMPNLVGANLQVAQNAVQEKGVFYSVSHDLLGMRMQVMDSNWQVCDQTPAAGARIAGPASEWEGQIDFGVVKLTETCP